MHSVANATGAIDFVWECTGMTLSVQYNDYAIISLNVPSRENLRHLVNVLTGKLGAKPVEHTNTLLGRRTWTWNFSETRALKLMHFMSDRGRAHSKNFIRLMDTGDYTGHYGPAN